MEEELQKVTYNKLIRDKVPENMAEKGAHFEITSMSEAEYLDALKRKMVEESGELLKAETFEDEVKELADLLEVIEAYKGVRFSMAIEEARKTALEKKGGFEKRIKLLWSERQ
jgi:predicted house-cleaning noncanonical NTP pyrophosphatase (MazG superfamily)